MVINQVNIVSVTCCTVHDHYHAHDQMMITPLPPLPMNTAEFISIKEAAERYSKAEITIRRFVRTVVENAAAKERKEIRPLPQEAEKLKKQKRPFAYTISTELLVKKFGADIAQAQAKKQEAAHPEFDKLIERMNSGLLEQLKVKDEQIKALNTSLEQLSERQRETNVLMKILQERLLLPAQTETAATEKKGWWSLWKK